MPKLKLTITTLFAALTLVLVAGVASSGAAIPISLQGSTQDEPAAVDRPGVTPLAGFVTPSPIEPWLAEVRVPVIVANTTNKSLPADLTALGGMQFILRDTDGNTYGIDAFHPQRAALPGHSLRFLEPAISARWTLGFQVPLAATTNLSLDLLDGAAIVDSWQLDELPTRTAMTNASPAVPSVALGETFTWQPAVEVSAVAVGSRVCGDPTIEPVAQVFTVTFNVANSGATEIRWPGYVHRDGSSVAQWPDGTSADMTMETYVGDEEALPRVSSSAVRLPAATSATRALVFVAPRDGRFTDVATMPGGILLRTGLGDVWLDLAAAESTVGISPALCDIGFFGGPIPFSQAPGAKFLVGGEPGRQTAESADEAARSLLTEALAGAAAHYDRNNQSFAGVTADALMQQAPRLTLIAVPLGVEPDAAAGTVYFGLREDDDDFISMATLSGSGRWFCAGVTPHRSAVAADGFDFAEIAAVCAPTTTVEEG